MMNENPRLKCGPWWGIRSAKYSLVISAHFTSEPIIVPVLLQAVLKLEAEKPFRSIRQMNGKIRRMMNENLSEFEPWQSVRACKVFARYFGALYV